MVVLGGENLTGPTEAIQNHNPEGLHVLLDGTVLDCSFGTFEASFHHKNQMLLFRHCGSPHSFWETINIPRAHVSIGKESQCESQTSFVVLRKSIPLFPVVQMAPKDFTVDIAWHPTKPFYRFFTFVRD